MASKLQALKDQLALVFQHMGISGRRGRRQVVFGEEAFGALLGFLELAPKDQTKVTDLIFRLSLDQPAVFVAEVYNVLAWSAEGTQGIDLEAIAEWFYTRQARKIEIALQVDIFPSNSMEESLRILEEIEKHFPHLRSLCKALRIEVNHRLAEEESWAKYRRDTFEMPKEMTGSILNIIKNIKER